MKDPKVTVIIPYSKDRGWLNEAVDSVEKQSYAGEIELILSQSDKSVGYNINRGIEKSTGEYIKYLCDDDRLTEWSIQLSVESIEGFDFIHGNSINFWDSGKKVAYIPSITNPTTPQMLDKNIIHGGTLMYRRDVFDRVGMFDESLDCAEEYEFNLRCLSKGLKLGYCPTFLIRIQKARNTKKPWKHIRRIPRSKKKKDSTN